MNYFRSDFCYKSILYKALCVLLCVMISAASERLVWAQKITKPITDDARKVDSEPLEMVEELSESLTNDLLEPSIATRDWDAEVTANFFPSEIAAKSFPSRPSALVNQVKMKKIYTEKQIVGFVREAKKTKITIAEFCRQKEI